MRNLFLFSGVAVFSVGVVLLVAEIIDRRRKK